jgi:hypothetical protein
MMRRLGFATVDLGHRSLVAALALVIGLTLSESARALEIKCIEGSKYKYLFQIFGDDPERFASTFQIEKSQLPDPEMCRAILVTGPFKPIRRGDSEEDDDLFQLYRAIAENRGWLATVYLSSPGGTVGTAMRFAFLTRMFWLKTYAPGATFIYTPDFFVPPTFSDRGTEPADFLAEDLPPDLLSGWQKYRKSAEPHSRIELPAGVTGRCTSACTYPLVAGIERYGTPYVHRGQRAKVVGKPGQTRPDEPSLADLVELLQRSEERVVAFYRKMDAGEKVIRLYQSTSTATVAPASMSRSPRFIADYLRLICRVDVNAPVTSKRGLAELCVAAAHEKERLRQYAKLCGDACDRRMLWRHIGRQIRELDPRDAFPIRK